MGTEADGLPADGRSIVLTSNDVADLTPLHRLILCAASSSLGISK